MKLKLSNKQKETIKLMKEGWYILHAPSMTGISPTYTINKITDGKMQSKTANILMIKSLREKQIIDICGIHGNQAMMNLTKLGETIETD